MGSVEKSSVFRSVNHLGDLGASQYLMRPHVNNGDVQFQKSFSVEDQKDTGPLEWICRFRESHDAKKGDLLLKQRLEKIFCSYKLD